jgi:hypothetical protein
MLWHDEDEMHEEDARMVVVTLSLESNLLDAIIWHPNSRNPGLSGIGQPTCAAPSYFPIHICTPLQVNFAREDEDWFTVVLQCSYTTRKEFWATAGVPGCRIVEKLSGEELSSCG